MFDRLTELVSGAWWSYLVIFAVAYLDVIIPLVPSETLVVTAGVIASSGDLHLPLVILCGALGAFLGDNTVYFIGRRWGDPVKRRFFSSKKATGATGLGRSPARRARRGADRRRAVHPGRADGGVPLGRRPGDAVAPLRDVRRDRRHRLGVVRGHARLRRRQAVRGGAVEGPRARAAHRLLDRRRRSSSCAGSCGGGRRAGEGQA